jgi:hypothetical protein
MKRSHGGRQARYRESWARWRALDEAAFVAAVSECRYAADVLRKLGFELSGGNYASAKRRITALGLDTSHWLKGRPPAGRPLQAALVPGGYAADTNRTRVKRRLLEAGVLRNECYICGMGPEWRGQELVLILDHVNGVNDDYTAANLRLVCPNCNSQLPTHAGRNARRRKS